MHARVDHGHYNVGDEAKIRRAVQYLLLPELKEAPGFRRYLGGFDHERRTLVAITVWDTVEQARAIDAQASPFGVLVRFEPAALFEISEED